jgi:hypothetical protein
MDPRLSSLYKGFSNEDPAPERVKPMPMQILHHADRIHAPDDALAAAAIDLAWIAVFYLLRPGEYCKSADNKPILFRHVGLRIGERILDTTSCPIHELLLATASSITFDDQKNRERGEIIAHALSGHPRACPTKKALARRLVYLRSTQHHHPTTPLCAVRFQQRWTFVTSSLLTTTLQASAAALPVLGFQPDQVTARSMRAGGAMALLCGRVDANIIRLVGRWKSDAMFRYLHAQALPLVQNLATTMLNHGTFTLAPGADLPPAAAAILQIPGDGGPAPGPITL